MAIFVSPDDPQPDAPVELIESARIIDELFTLEGMDALLCGSE